MAWVAVDRNGTERIFSDYMKPIRGYYTEYLGQWIGIGIIIPKGSIKKLIGYELTWENEAVELNYEN